MGKNSSVSSLVGIIEEYEKRIILIVQLPVSLAFAAWAKTIGYRLCLVKMNSPKGTVDKILDYNRELSCTLKKKKKWTVKKSRQPFE